VLFAGALDMGAVDDLLSTLCPGGAETAAVCDAIRGLPL
jgi:hypothetical protein